MFYQPELLEEEVTCYKRIITKTHGFAEATKIKQTLDKHLNRYAAGETQIEHLEVQTIIVQVRARLVRETTGPKGLEGFYFTAMLQHVLDWNTLAEDDRESFSYFLESEEQRHCAGSDKDAMQHRQSFQTMESRRSDNDYMVVRAYKTIPSAELRQLFTHKLKSAGAASIAEAGREQGCSHCGDMANYANLKTCAGCKTAFYCNVKCQSADWKAKHKQICRYAARAKLALVGGHGSALA